MIKIPIEALSTEALNGVIDEYVVREGTDYGHRDYSLEEKRCAVRRQLAAGKVEIWFDPELASTTLRVADAASGASADVSSENDD
jgi:uncharacterized protein YheU (UPF0270 family)